MLATNDDWWEVGHWSSDAWAALAAWATIGVLLGSLWFAGKQIREAREARREQTRPFVIVDLTTDVVIDLEVRNTGLTVARDVHIVFDPPLVSTLSRPWPWEESTIFTEGIPTLAPGRVHRLVFDQGPARLDSDLPRVHRVELSYRGADGHEYPDVQFLDLNVMLGTHIWTEPIEKMADSIGQLANLATQWNKTGRFAVSAESNRRMQLFEARKRAMHAADRAYRANGRWAATITYLRTLWRAFRVRHVSPF
jgi:hypothetical protein